MTIETDFYATLQTNAGVTAIVGAKLYPHVAPEGTAAPFLTYHMVVGTPFNQISKTTTLEKKRIQINCWSDSYAGAQTLAEAVKTALNSDGHLALEIENYVDEAQLYRRIIDWMFIA